MEVVKFKQGQLRVSEDSEDEEEVISILLDGHYVLSTLMTHGNNTSVHLTKVK